MKTNDITKICKALGDPNRMSIINMLQERKLNATEILTRLQITQPTLSHHMKLLTDCKAVVSCREGNATIYSINKEVMNQLTNALTVFGGGVVSESSSDSNKLSSQEINYQNKLLSIAQKAHIENAAKTDFLMHMSHDLRIPISGIKGMLLVIRKNLDNPENLENLIEYMKDYIGKMEDATDQLESFLDEILDMSEIENSRDGLLVQAFNIFDTARELNTIYASKSEKAGLTYKAEVKGDISHPYILSSRVYMKRIFQIILDNAIRYNNEHGSITVSFEEIASTDKTTTHRIVISDTGRGMTPEMINHLYNPFDDDFTDNRYSELGLSIVKRLVDKKGGKMKITSALQEGTTITLEMTFEIDKKAEELYANSSETGINGKRILLVEDNELNLEVAQFILTDAGAQVVTARNGKEAVNIVKGSVEGEFNLILMDLMMPIMNGFTATDIIRNMDRSDTKNIPILAMSANAFEDDIRKSLESGMNEHISKPLNVTKLITILNKWI